MLFHQPAYFINCQIQSILHLVMIIIISSKHIFLKAQYIYYLKFIYLKYFCLLHAYFISKVQ